MNNRLISSERNPGADNGKPEGLIWKIDRFAVHDGPGIRTSVYFKGCPLSCLWCANPEGQKAEKELGFLETRCNRCGLCLTSCPREALQMKNGLPAIDYSKCDLCGSCVSACPTDALYIYGEYYSISQILEILERDRHIYRRSGGGITCTGGEPLLQARFLSLLLTRCRERGIHAALETCGLCDEAQLSNVLANVDWLYFDLKHVDEGHHLKLTGCKNKTILNNLRIASEITGARGKTLVVRQVIVPSLNDCENIDALIGLLTGLHHIDMVELLPYHSYGSYKYKALGRSYQLEHVQPPSGEEMQKYKRIIEASGIRCDIGNA